MPRYSTLVPVVSAADAPAAEQLLFTVGRAGVLPSRAIAAGSLKLCCVSLVRCPNVSEQPRATDVVLVEDGNLIYWPRTGEVFANAVYAMARVQATLA